MALSAELLKRLDEEDEPIEKRIRLALLAFESNELPVQRKEELTLHWLFKRGEKDFNSDAWNVLELCLTSNHMKKLSGTNIKQSVKKCICDIFIKLLNDVTVDNSTILDCCMHVIEKEIFQQYFKRELKQYFELLVASINCTLREEKSDYCFKIIQNINLLNKQVFDREEFATLFISKLPVIVKIQTYLECSSNVAVPRIKAEIFKCVQQVLFPKSRFKDLSHGLRFLFEGDDCNHCGFLGSIFECLSNTITDTLFSEALCPVIFHAFVSSYKNDPISVYRFFVGISYLIGFKPEVKLSNNESKCLLKHKRLKKSFPEIAIKKSGTADEKSLKIMKELVTILTEASVELDADSEVLPFHQWLQSLVSVIFSMWSSSEDEQILANILEIFCIFIKLDPLIIEPKIAVILDIVMLSKKESPILKSAYAVFMKNILQMFVKLSRLQKFVAKLLGLGKSLEGRNVEELPSVLDVLTSGFCGEFQIAVAMLPGWQTIATMRSLLYHLNQDCVTPLEKAKGDLPILFLEITSKLLCQFLRGTRMAEHSVPLQVVTKFGYTMKELEQLLGRLGQAILQKEHDCALMRAFLQLSYYWGEMKILLLHYGVKPETTSADLHMSALQQDISATNLTYLHPYLSSELWNLVAQRISNFAEDDVKELLEKMVLQKLRVIVLFLDEGKLKQDITTSIARHVASHIRESRTFLLSETNCSLVAPYLNSEQLEIIADCILEDEISDTKSSVNVIESREFVVALTNAALNGIMKLFSRTKRKRDTPNHGVKPPSLIRDVLSKIDSGFILKCFLENDLDALLPAVSEIAELVNEALRKEKDVVNGHRVDITALYKYLQLLKTLPLQYAPSNIKLLVVMSMAALAITLEQLDTWKENNQSTQIRELLYKDLLLNLLDSGNSSDISCYLDIGQLAHWFTKVDTQLSRDLYSLLFKRLFESSLVISSSFEQLQTGLPMLQKHASVGCHSVQEMQAAIELLHVLNKCPNIHENSDHSLREKYQRRVTQGIMKTMQCEQEGSLSPIACEGFNIVLLYYLRKADQKNLKKLTPRLREIIESALTHLQEQETLSSKCYMDILATALRHKQQLNEFLPVDLIRRMWTTLNSHQVGSLEDWKLLFETASEKEFQIIVKDLEAFTKAELKSTEGFESLKMRMLIWKAFVLSKFNHKKINSRKVALERLCQALSVYFNEMCNPHFEAAENAIHPVLELLITIAQNTLMYFSAEMLDVCFKSIKPMYMLRPNSVFISVSTCLRLLQTLIKNREPLILDRIPSLLNCYREMTKAIANIGHVEKGYTSAEVQQCADCAQRLERLTNSFKVHKLHFARVAPYLIADILQNFETYSLYPEIKLHFSNCINALLDMCDIHALSFLSRTLSPASQQLLKTYHTSYNKYYRFTGKV